MAVAHPPGNPLALFNPTLFSLSPLQLPASHMLLSQLNSVGYPTFVVLGRIFTYLPFNSVAWRVNLVSVISGTVAAAAL